MILNEGQVSMKAGYLELCNKGVDVFHIYISIDIDIYFFRYIDIYIDIYIFRYI